MTQEHSIEELLNRMLAMSKADMSVLLAAVDAASRGKEAQMTTVDGSENYMLWRALADLGWLKEEPRLPIEGLETFKLFRVEPRGVADLQKLLSQFRGRRQYQRMAEIYETFCVPFSREMLQRVNDMEGDYADVGLLLGLTLARTLQQSVAPDSYDRAVEQIANIARQQLAKERRVDH